MTEFAKVGTFCPNPVCPDYEQVQERRNNIIKFGHISSDRQRFKFRKRSETFTETRGTIFYRRRTDDEEILECLAMIAEGLRISGVSRVKGHKEDTVSAWVRDAAEHAEAVEDILFPSSRSAGDRSTVCGRMSLIKAKKKGYPETEESGQFFRSTMIDTDSRLRQSRTDGEASGSPLRRLSFKFIDKAAGVANSSPWASKCFQIMRIRG